MWSLYDSSTAWSCFSNPLSSPVTEMNRKVLKTYFKNSPNNFQQVLQCLKNYCWCMTVADITPQWFYSPGTQLPWPQRSDRPRRQPGQIISWFESVEWHPLKVFIFSPTAFCFFSVPELNMAVCLTAVILKTVLIRSKHIKRGGVEPI